VTGPHVYFSILTFTECKIIRFQVISKLKYKVMKFRLLSFKQYKIFNLTCKNKQSRQSLSEIYLIDTIFLSMQLRWSTILIKLATYDFGRSF